jgi:hypothetical protein
MKNEKLEEAAKNYIKLPLHKDIDGEERYYNSNIKSYDAFIEGAKWQQERSYSEEDLKEGFRSNYTPFSATNTGDFDEDFDRWFKQFKKK